MLVIDAKDALVGRRFWASGYMARIFSVFATHGVDIETMATTEVSVSMTVSAKEKKLKKKPQGHCN